VRALEAGIKRVAEMLGDYGADALDSRRLGVRPALPEHVVDRAGHPARGTIVVDATKCKGGI
jgi:hypothetical protein